MWVYERCISYSRLCVGAGVELTEAVSQQPPNSANEPRQPSSPEPAVSLRAAKHNVLLLGVAADSPARQKMAAWPGAAAYQACGWCSFRGSRAAPRAATRFAGYSEPADGQLPVHGPVHAWDEGLRVSDPKQRARAEATDRWWEGAPPGKGLDGLWSLTPQQSGCNGLSPLIHSLDYVSYNDVWMLPLYHAGKTLRMLDSDHL